MARKRGPAALGCNASGSARLADLRTMQEGRPTSGSLCTPFSPTFVSGIRRSPVPGSFDAVRPHDEGLGLGTLEFGLDLRLHVIGKAVMG